MVFPRLPADVLKIFVQIYKINRPNNHRAKVILLVGREPMQLLLVKFSDARLRPTAITSYVKAIVPSIVIAISFIRYGRCKWVFYKGFILRFLYCDLLSGRREKLFFC